MSKKIKLPSGKVLVFPDNTSDEVIEKVKARYAEKKPEVKKPTPKLVKNLPTPAPAPKPAKTQNESKVFYKLDGTLAKLSTELSNLVNLQKREALDVSYLEDALVAMQETMDKRFEEIMKAINAPKDISIKRSSDGKVEGATVKIKD